MRNGFIMRCYSYIPLIHSPHPWADGMCGELKERTRKRTDTVKRLR